MADIASVEALLTKLRESRLSSDERRSNLEALKGPLSLIAANTTSGDPANNNGLHVLTTAILNGPNDVRRFALQSISSSLENKPQRDDFLLASSELVKAIEAFLRTTLKVQPSKAVSLPSSRSGLDIASLSTSTLRAMTAALKTLHALLRVTPKAGPSRNAELKPTTNLASLFDILLPCFSAGIHAARHTSASLPRSRSSLQAGAFTWGDQSRRSLTTAHACAASTTSSTEKDLYSSSGETDRKSDKSESEQSDVSTVSMRSRSDDARLQETTTKLIRQNALHSFVELNRLESRALISRWADLLPDQPPPSAASSSSTANASATAFSRFSSNNVSHSVSLCSIMTTDPSTSVRLAAVAALESILSHGALQFSMAQERAQRALSFTSLSSQLAGWIVNIRSHLVLALQRASSATGYPSSLAVALLKLTRTFVVSTGKARLVQNHASVLGPVVAGLAAAGGVPEVQAEAKRVVASLIAAANGESKRAVSGSIPDAVSSDALAGTGPSAADAAQLSARTDLPGVGAELTTETCTRVLVTLESSQDPIRELPTWTALLKSLAEAGKPLLNPTILAQLQSVSSRMLAASDRSSELQCSVLGSVPDFCKALSVHSGLDSPGSALILEYVRTNCGSPDEAVRAAAVRVLGLLVLPSDAASAAMEEHLDRVSSALDEALWPNSDVVSGGALQDKSSLVRQRAAWAFSNAMEAQLRAATSHGTGKGAGNDEQRWITSARYCLKAGKDMEGVAVSACRTSGSLLAMLPAAASVQVCSLGRCLLEQLCKVLGTSSKPPKSRWNAASALERALSSNITLSRILELDSGHRSTLAATLADRIIELLCSNLGAKVFKIRVNAANALLSLCLGSNKGQDQAWNPDRLGLLGEQRCSRIRGFASARLAELDAEAGQSKEAVLYGDELKRILARLAAIPLPVE